MQKDFDKCLSDMFRILASEISVPDNEKIKKSVDAKIRQKSKKTNSVKNKKTQ